MVLVRRAAHEDDAALRAIDDATWSPAVTPTPRVAEGTPFFGDRADPNDVLVADVDGTVAGYLALSQSFDVESHRHVLRINGLAVDPTYQRRGIGRLLLDAAADEARRRGARKVTLRVLGNNVAARRLYESAGFVVEGVLVDEFMLDGRLVDDIFMAMFLY